MKQIIDNSEQDTMMEDWDNKEESMNTKEGDNHDMGGGKGSTNDQTTKNNGDKSVQVNEIESSNDENNRIKEIFFTN